MTVSLAARTASVVDGSINFECRKSITNPVHFRNGGRLNERFDPVSSARSLIYGFREHVPAVAALRAGHSFVD